MLHYQRPLLDYVYRSETMTGQLIDFIAPRIAPDDEIEQAQREIESLPEYIALSISKR